ncbi:pyruvate dehydrogenase complex dihydrolipoamide acetyltransferase [Pollutimonas harenae]|uniref:Acetyltransferase component of pyruvate dehydrogenase complex n=1 Tax=Pollutimonas harenae TaxID=657015 RepID=A0A853H3J8_9BURK|nr:pyruvate dehydrogenase complex dihydrolipoamide acetyltransferase [Pollutimonas harenae]NYT84714.1 pyruvate dehydrogenase complex dihydrolipoamide acetyltransferase [Pollutimonas harenae]TEA72884.1 pyruvate dehydrogenase complex dihydrolipoamide acetyltransferase [Pollutimonas harenae]
MATLVRMPEVAANTDSAVIVSWALQEGEAVAEGDCLAEIETEKAVIEFNAEQAGVLGKILVQAGKEVEVGTPIAVLFASDEKDVDIAALLSAGASEPGAADVAVAAPEQSTSPSQAPVRDPAPVASTASDAASHERIFASPLAKRLARDAGINLSGLAGSGPQGRVVKRDVLAAQQAAAASVAVGTPAVATPAAGQAQSYTDVPHTSMRRTIARRLSESKQTVPHFYLRADCRMDALLAMRKQINQSGVRKVSVNDIIVKAVAAALRQLPEMNVSWTESALRHYQDIDISVAVSTPTGLITPVVKGVDTKSLSNVSLDIADLAHRAREGKLAPHEYQGGSFTVSNLGMYGVQEFAAIINPPQAAILAVGGFEQRPSVIDGTLGIASVMTVTLSVDHRAIDGALAAKWLGIFKSVIENPLAALI